MSAVAPAAEAATEALDPLMVVSGAVFDVRACAALLGGMYMSLGIRGSNEAAFRFIEKTLIDQADALEELEEQLREELTERRAGRVAATAIGGAQP